MQTLRGKAFGRLAALTSSPSAQTSTPDADFTKLCDACPTVSRASNGGINGFSNDSSATGKVSMSLRELEVLLALCEAAPAIEDIFSANRFLHQITPYVAESCYQAIAPSPFLQDLRPSPWEILTFRLVDSTLRLGARHPTLRDKANSSLNTYMESCKRFSSYLSRNGPNDISVDAHGGANQEALSVLVLAASLLGFLEAAAITPSFWRQKDQNELLLTIQGMLSDKFLLTVERTLSSLRNIQEPFGAVKEWKHYLKNYASSGRPFGAMALQQSFTQVVQAFAAPLALSSQLPAGVDILDQLMERLSTHRNSLPIRFDSPLLETLASISSQEIVNVDEGSDYLQLGSAWQQRLGHSVKATSLVTFLCCSLANDEVAEQDVLMSWLEATLDDSNQASDEELASVVLKSMAILATVSTGTASGMCRSIQRFLIGGAVPATIASVAATSLLFVLKLLPQDTTITTLYSLGNSISVSSNSEAPGRFALFNDASMEATPPINGNGIPDEKDSSSKRSPSASVVQPTDAYNSTVSAIVIIAKGYKDDKIMELALSMLIQKVGKVSKAVDLKIITEAASLASEAGVSSLRALLRLYNRLHSDGVARNDQLMIRAISDARDFLSMTLKGSSDLYELYLHDLLETIVRKGEVTPTKHTNSSEFESATHELALLLRPLALLILHNLQTPGIEDVESFPALQRDAWYNIIVHGFTIKSLLTKRYVGELRILAKYSRPLIDEDLANKLESDIDLNTVLRRGKHTDNKSRTQIEMCDLLPNVESEIKSLSYPELMFLKAAYIVETMRASTGFCTRVLDYFIDPQLRGSDLGKCMRAMALRGIDIYLSHALNATRESFYTPEVAEQLSLIFEGCCHRVADVQDISYACVDRILNQIPSALCQRASLFSLLDLLTILWTSCLESETDEYEWKSLHKAPRGETRLRLSDNYSFRRVTLRKFHQYAKIWVGKATNIAPLDVKGLLQTYLSDYSDDEAFGHLSLGRSFAFDMGAMVPVTDQRLGAIEREDELHINTASDFMSHYTTRQEYRFTDPLRAQDMRMINGTATSMDLDLSKPTEIIATLAKMEMQLLKRDFVAMSHIRDVLRRAASLLCRTSGDQASIAAHFVRIPFLLFSKQIIKFGLSLWMGVIKENPDMESRILVEIIECWITTVRGKLGIFNKRMIHVDPFFLKEEFAPSDKETNLKQQKRAHDLIAPHFRVLQFLASHYMATRLNNSTIEDNYLRFLKITLKGLRTTAGHPLAREVHFHIVLLGLKVLRHCTSLDATARWRLKDDLLSAGLAWFAHPPRWSFGGNRLQIKAETHLLADVASMLTSLSQMGIHVPTPLRSLQGKQDLLQMLISDEMTRLMVWLFPLDQTKRHFFGTDHAARPSAEAIRNVLPIAWEEDADLAINLASRFKSDHLDHKIRWYILNFPEKAMDNPDALQLMLRSTLPNDVSTQLKYLMYWTPVNPITAATFFMPAYDNHPCIVQYAVRALESHSVDVTFFYVPQIVQTLRYDVLGYVARYIIETAKFSQLFAHQIIWNMKANAFKDEDSEIPDPVKPTLDIVMDKLVSSFSVDDRAFYEREFHFFGEITDISGKLKPFIKKSKPEKKQKIEEELRQIQLEVGVYLPSNPDGVVVGIDRKSGKPLQSHAKAPYMATFRIRKEKNDDIENTEEQLAAVNDTSAKGSTQPATFEVWQSAIFKVGDDCRQDVLALQMIALFRGIFHYVGLPVYVFPYRVTATAPGCGVIDVLPNSISRDMLGREAVNGLHDWFLASFGSEDSPAFQVARNNFVKSLAAYSVISYLLQFKDRHNGNIMFDDQGHILHVDFGFCFDIAPGGVRFERAPFKLTKEMIAVLGGGMETQAFRWFEELCVKAFLAARPFFEQLSHLVLCMLDSGLPCFKPETMAHFRERFVLEKTEREAAEYMKGLVHKSYGSLSTKGYDQFQLLTNGIPY